jgi:hypothetical protein
MGAVIVFPEVRRGAREAYVRVPGMSAAVIILPVVRIERANAEPAALKTAATKSPSGRKRGRRASRP